MIHKCYKFGAYPDISAVVVSGSTLTVQNLAPSILEIRHNSMVTGEPMPLCGIPHYDEDENTGFASMMARSMDYADLAAVAQSEEEPEGERTEGEPSQMAVPDDKNTEGES